MNKNDERLIDTIRNVKTNTFTSGIKRLIIGLWRIFVAM
jgi:hypothetical protein